MTKLSLFSKIKSLLLQKHISDIVKKCNCNKVNKSIESRGQLTSMIFCHFRQANYGAFQIAYKAKGQYLKNSLCVGYYLRKQIKFVKFALH